MYYIHTYIHTSLYSADQWLHSLCQTWIYINQCNKKSPTVPFQSAKSSSPTSCCINLTPTMASVSQPTTAQIEHTESFWGSRKMTPFIKALHWAWNTVMGIKMTPFISWQLFEKIMKEYKGIRIEIGQLIDSFKLI